MLFSNDPSAVRYRIKPHEQRCRRTIAQRQITHSLHDKSLRTSQRWSSQWFVLPSFVGPDGLGNNKQWLQLHCRQASRSAWTPRRCWGLRLWLFLPQGCRPQRDASPYTRFLLLLQGCRCSIHEIFELFARRHGLRDDPCFSTAYKTIGRPPQPWPYLFRLRVECSLLHQSLVLKRAKLVFYFCGSSVLSFFVGAEPTTANP